MIALAAVAGAAALLVASVPLVNSRSVIVQYAGEALFVAGLVAAAGPFLDADAIHWLDR